jgi:hypothetical protein
VTAPPVLPDFQVRNAVTRASGTVNQTDQRAGVSYAGVRYEFAVFPQEVGLYAISDQKITVTYAADPPQSRIVPIALPRIAFEAFIPDAAQGLNPFVAAAALTMTQTVKRSSQDLKVGDSLTRTVTVKADGTPAMLLPVIKLAEIDGLALYPAQPSLEDNFDRRTSSLSATRVDEAIYMLEKAGDYTLPAIVLAWWNARDGKVEQAEAGAIVLHVADNPAAQTNATVERGLSRRDWQATIEWILDHWLSLFALLLALSGMLWFVPTALRSIRRRIARKRNDYLGSETWSFARLGNAVRGREPEKIYFALLEWLERFSPTKPLHTIEAFRNLAQDPELDHEIALLEARLFGPPGRDINTWAPRRLMQRIKRARRRLLGQPAVVAARAVLPRDLNPLATYPQRLAQRRPVAR